MTLFLCLCAFLGDPSTYGKTVTEDSPLVSIDTLMAQPERYLDKVVRVKGKVTEVCPKAGCWLDLRHQDRKVRIKVRDGEIVFDKKLIGQEVIAEGTVYKFELDKDQAVQYFRHLAEEKGEAFDPNSVTKGTTIYQIGGIGVAVL